MEELKSCTPARHKQYQCPVEATLKIIGGKYKPIILWNLIEHPLRHTELLKIAKTATPKVLTEQLKELERDKIISRTAYAEVPPKVVYSLTEYGKTIIPILDAMCEWGKEHLNEQ